MSWKGACLVCQRDQDALRSRPAYLDLISFAGPFSNEINAASSCGEHRLGAKRPHQRCGGEHVGIEMDTSRFPQGVNGDIC